MDTQRLRMSQTMRQPKSLKRVSRSTNLVRLISSLRVETCVTCCVLVTMFALFVLVSEVTAFIVGAMKAVFLLDRLSAIMHRTVVIATA